MLIPDQETAVDFLNYEAVATAVVALLKENRQHALTIGIHGDWGGHNEGHAIKDYRRAWHTACVLNGLGLFLCRTCQDEKRKGKFVLDVDRRCPNCGKKWESPKYEGRIMHDFRRSAAHEMWKSGSTKEERMEVTGHKTAAMFLRYADVFSEDERRTIQRKVQGRRNAWREEQSATAALPRRGLAN